MRRSDDDGGAMDRLVAMGSGPADGPVTEPFRIVEATPPPAVDVLGGPPTQQMSAVPGPDFAYQPTVAQPLPDEPAVVYEPAVYEPAVYEPAVYESVPTVLDPPLEPPLPRQRRDWGPAIAMAFVALLVGGAVGFLIGRGSNDDDDRLTAANTAQTTPLSTPLSSDPVDVEQAAIDQRVTDMLTMLVAQAEQNGGPVLPTPFPQLDQLLTLAASSGGTQASDAQGAVAALTSERDQLAASVSTLEEQATTLQEQLTQAQAERDELQSQLDESGSDGQQNDQQQARIDQLEADLATAQADLDTANDQLADIQQQLDQANAALDQLNVLEAPNVVGRPVNEIRNLARSNGWQLVERPVDQRGSAPDTVTLQVPAEGSTMVNGSVLYVEVAQPPQ